MASKKKLLQAAAGSAGGAGGLNVEEVFSVDTFHPNTAGDYPVNNGIDLDGEGGLVIMKNRISTSPSIPLWHDTERWGGSYQGYLRSDADNGAASTAYFTSFDSDGFTPKDMNNEEMVGWTFRKAPKFFDCIQYTGNGTSGRTISHNLGCDVGMLIIKKLDGGQDWSVWHRGANNGTNANQWFGWLNLIYAFDDGASPFNDTAPTSTEFTLGSSSEVNANGSPYIAYIFAHNDGDGEFGPTGDQDIIKCGSYQGNGISNGPEFDLGFEPQWLMFKSTTGVNSPWLVYDTMRGITTGYVDCKLTFNTSDVEDNTSNFVEVNATGFKIRNSDNEINNDNSTYIYVAIRRGPMAVPESATDVFDATTDVSAASKVNTGFPVDWQLIKDGRTSTGGIRSVSRLTTVDTSPNFNDFRQAYYMLTSSADAQTTSGTITNNWDSTGFEVAAAYGSNTMHWSWSRAPNFFDVVCYKGDSTAGRTVSHNLGVAPEMIFVKVRNLSSNWVVWHTGKELYLSLSAAKEANPLSFNNTNPTDTSFTLNSYNSVNGSGYDYVAYLFASLDGISKVGTYTGNGSSQTIDCGFSNGARFVMIKRSDDVSNWAVFDTERGISTGNDPLLSLNLTSAESTGLDVVDPASSGFIVNDIGTYFNESGGTYIFYAIA